jgi:hypothetical protein
MLDEELNSSLEGALLASLHLGLAQVTTDCKAMRASREILAHISRLVLPIAKELICDLLLLRREHTVLLTAVDEDGVVGLSLQLFEVTGHLQKGRVRDDDGLGDVLKSEIDGVTTTKAVSRGTEGCDTLLLESLDDGIEDGAGAFLAVVVAEPGTDVKVFARTHSISRNSISVEVVRNYGVEPIRSEVISQELSIGENVAKHVGKEEQGLVLRIIAGRSGYIAFDTPNLFDLALMESSGDADSG